MVSSSTRFAVCLTAALSVTCATTPEKLPELDRRFYRNLSTPVQREAFLKLDAQRRRDFLDRSGLWQRWIELSPDERAAAEAGQVKLDFREFAVFMALGRPADTQTTTLPSGYEMVTHTFIRCTSGPKIGVYVLEATECDGTSSETKVSFLDGRVVEIKYPD